VIAQQPKINVPRRFQIPRVGEVETQKAANIVRLDAPQGIMASELGGGKSL
jgi:hypothetical protein